MQKQCNLNRVAEKCKALTVFFIFGPTVVICQFRSLKTLSKPTMTTVRPKMKKTVKSFYIFLQLCYGYTVSASQSSETNFTKFPFVRITHIWQVLPIRV